jgi:hypothetical protein
VVGPAYPTGNTKYVKVPMLLAVKVALNPNIVPSTESAVRVTVGVVVS